MLSQALSLTIIHFDVLDLVAGDNCIHACVVCYSAGLVGTQLTITTPVFSNLVVSCS